MILETRNLTKRYRGVPVVDSVDLHIEKGDVFGFLGPNGAGKTTTIRMILGLIKPSGGEVFIDGISVQKEFAKAIKNIAGIVETPKFYEDLTAYQNLKLLKNFHKEVPKARIEEVLELVTLKHAANQKFKTFSLGMKQRLGLAAALLNKPKIIILDEPTNGLDPKGVVAIRNIIMKLVEKESITVLISSHILHEVELMCNKVAIISKGKLIASGLTREMLNNQNQVTFTVDDCDKAQHALSHYEGAVVSCEENRLLLNEACLASHEANSLLVQAGVRVSGIVPSNKTLEEYFMETVDGRRV